ncbi:MAG: hypothetical protein PHH49_08720, partial [Candidatus Omnitrophica bacterium]|nr:hypothetical protein [Candidatus Omnitrophota bacterium]
GDMLGVINGDEYDGVSLASLMPEAIAGSEGFQNDVARLGGVLPYEVTYAILSDGQIRFSSKAEIVFNSDGSIRYMSSTEAVYSDDDVLLRGHTHPHVADADAEFVGDMIAVMLREVVYNERVAEHILERRSDGTLQVRVLRREGDNFILSTIGEGVPATETVMREAGLADMLTLQNIAGIRQGMERLEAWERLSLGFADADTSDTELIRMLSVTVAAYLEKSRTREEKDIAEMRGLATDLAPGAGGLSSAMVGILDVGKGTLLRSAGSMTLGMIALAMSTAYMNSAKRGISDKMEGSADIREDEQDGKGPVTVLHYEVESAKAFASSLSGTDELKTTDRNNVLVVSADMLARDADGLKALAKDLARRNALNRDRQQGIIIVCEAPEEALDTVKGWGDIAEVISVVTQDELADKIAYVKRADMSVDTKVTGIFTGNEPFFGAVSDKCDSYIIAGEDFTFGMALALALTRANYVAFAGITDEGINRLREVARREKEAKSGREIIRLESAGSKEADKAIDEALFADLAADTAF